MMEGPTMFYYHRAKALIDNAVRSSAINERQVGDIALQLARDFDPYDPMPRTRVWPWVAGAVAFVVPLALVMVADLFGGWQ